MAQPDTLSLVASWLPMRMMSHSRIPVLQNEGRMEVAL
jgi:hypothetical protein